MGSSSLSTPYRPRVRILDSRMVHIDRQQKCCILHDGQDLGWVQRSKPWRLWGVSSRADDRRVSLWLWWRYSAKKSVYDWRKSMYHWITIYMSPVPGPPHPPNGIPPHPLYIYTIGDISQPWNVCASWGSMLPYDYLVVATGGSSHGISALKWHEIYTLW